jgi:uncharacterized alpha-E superfamily protein
VLSRIAESFFWIGRYVERAEATTRLLAEHHQLMVEDRQVPEDVACAVLLDALSMSHEDVVKGAGLVSAVTGRADEPSTITGAVSAARENARAIRDALSVDVYEALNATHLTLVRGLVMSSSPGVTLHRVLERLLVVNGVIEWTMPRDEGYLFLTLGQALERMDMTARILGVRHDRLWPESGPVATLRSSGALSAFMRTRSSLTGDDVRAFLVLDGQFPRSMRMSAATAEDAVRDLAAAGITEGGDLLHAVGMVHSRLEFAVDPSPDQVDGLAEAAQRAATAATEAAATGYFRQLGTLVWSH